jgi:hypothetical protein
MYDAGHTQNTGLDGPAWRNDRARRQPARRYVPGRERPRRGGHAVAVGVSLSLVRMFDRRDWRAMFAGLSQRRYSQASSILLQASGQRIWGGGDSTRKPDADEPPRHFIIS